CRYNDTRYAGRDQQIRARDPAGATLMARLERDIDGSAVRVVTRLRECLFFRVRTASFTRSAFADGRTLVDDDTPHRRIVARPPRHGCGERQSAAHVDGVGDCIHFAAPRRTSWLC